MRHTVLAVNLPQLQNLIKRDPKAYREEFLQQWNHYNSLYQIIQTSHVEQASRFRELVSFISQVAICYPKETVDFPSQLSSLLLEHYGQLLADTRKSLVQCLLMLRNKGVISSIELRFLKCLFPLLPRTTSQTLHVFLRKTILSVIRSANTSSKNHKLNRAVQAMLFGMVEQGLEGEVIGNKGKARVSVSNNAEHRDGEDAVWAVIMTKELWKEQIWSDSKSVSIVALGCLHPTVKVQSASIHFFLGNDEQKGDSHDEGHRAITKKISRSKKKIRGKPKSGKKQLSPAANFPALQILNDPQTFAERLFDMLHRHDKRFSLDHKILIMLLVSRVIGVHKLCVLGFYTYIMKYLTYHQLRISAILVALVQSVHELSPPDAITPIVRKVAQEFIHPGVGSEIITAGLNSIREVCRRQPLAMEEDLLGDLVEYRKSRDKPIVAAARGLLQLYREVDPEMLKRRERGKHASTEVTGKIQHLPFGYVPNATSDIDGLLLLEDHLQKLREEEGVIVNEDDDESNEAWQNWAIESSPSESSGEEEWIDVSSDSEQGFEISDSEDGQENTAKVEKDEKEQVAVNRLSTLATTKILTPADFALLNDLRIQATKEDVQAGGRSRAKRKLAALLADKNGRGLSPIDGCIAESDILAPRKKTKLSYADRISSIQEGREGREKFGSRKGKKNKRLPSSSTNSQKVRNKPIMMILSSRAVRSKKKLSLHEKQQKLRRHIEKVKKAHH